MTDLWSKNRNITKDYQDFKLVDTGECDCKRKFLNQLLPIAYTQKKSAGVKSMPGPGIIQKSCEFSLFEPRNPPARGRPLHVNRLLVLQSVHFR